MDVDLVSKNPIGPALSVTARPTSADNGFAAAMTTQVDGASTIERAERLIGTRVRAPEGGCSCDAFVSSVAPPAPPAPSAEGVADRAEPAQVTKPPTGTPPNGAVSPGRVLTLSDPNDLSGHLHRAILRNATEMITATRSGLVEVLTVPWDQVHQR